MTAAGVTTATDITGFGLAGHLGEMAVQSGVEIEIYGPSIPTFSGVMDLIREGIAPAKTLMTNSAAMVSESKIIIFYLGFAVVIGVALLPELFIPGRHAITLDAGIAIAAVLENNGANRQTRTIRIAFRVC